MPWNMTAEGIVLPVEIPVVWLDGDRWYGTQNAINSNHNHCWMFSTQYH